MSGGCEERHRIEQQPSLSHTGPEKRAKLGLPVVMQRTAASIPTHNSHCRCNNKMRLAAMPLLGMREQIQAIIVLGSRTKVSTHPRNQGYDINTYARQFLWTLFGILLVMQGMVSLLIYGFFFIILSCFLAFVFAPLVFSSSCHFRHFMCSCNACIRIARVTPSVTIIL